MSGRLRVNLAALADNYATFQSVSEAHAVAAVVKANAYGLGLEAVSRHLHQSGCRTFFVATAAEGSELRGYLEDVEIYVFEGVRAETAQLLATARLRPVINHTTQLEAWRPHANLPIAVHVDTGMERLGFPRTVGSGSFRGFEIALLLTHLACADTPEHELNLLQIERFAAVRVEFPGIPVSIGNSAGVLMGQDFQGDMGRPGIGLYGGNPFSDRHNPMKVVATLEEQILQLRTVSAGASVGYGATYTSPDDRVMAVLGLGYADGVPRILSNRGYVSLGCGSRCPIRGRISMDLTIIDVTDNEVHEGDWVELLGEDVSLDEVAGWADTVPYEILTGLGPRIPRIYC
ncbi:MAG: alanine racemase [Gammaproteobacteria bacterium]|nr:alanine racemase [Gammaproteobacteria bacterium]